MFILRRSAEILSNFLPPKTELIVFCRPTELQLELHRKLLAIPDVADCLNGRDAAFQLQAITLLRKICNAPKMLTMGDELGKFAQSVQSSIGNKPAVKQAGKLAVLERILVELSKSSEKVVIVSQFTQTLGVIQEMLAANNFTFTRLDGSTASTKRQTIVDTFNREPASRCFAFLLSAKSGGCGLNLIGASRLILYDSDWK